MLLARVYELLFTFPVRSNQHDPDDTLSDAGRIRNLSAECISDSTFPAVVLTPETNLKERMVQQIYRDIINHDVARRYGAGDRKTGGGGNDIHGVVPGSGHAEQHETCA